MCPIFQEHQFDYDAEQSSVSKSVFQCLCGSQITENEDAPSGC